MWQSNVWSSVTVGIVYSCFSIRLLLHSFSVNVPGSLTFKLLALDDEGAL